MNTITNHHVKNINGGTRQNVILHAEDLKKYYGSGETEVRALDGINLDIYQGDFVAVVGTSGSGKSTLLNMLGGLDTPTGGLIKVGGTELSGLSKEQATIFRRKQIGFVFQNYNLIPVLTVWENIIFPITLDGQKPDEKFILKVAELLGLTDKLDSLPNTLSGGQQQRAAIARALASKPSIILADEPTGNLDSKTSSDVIGLLKMTSEKFRQTIVMITHNPEIAQMADCVVRIEDGKIVEG
ncbi:MAG: ABC transporter ATP-binding protein [Dorea sp.]|nr:ABC transporter ATP-binding protein [Dorea sp.]